LGVLPVTGWGGKPLRGRPGVRHDRRRTIDGDVRQALEVLQSIRVLQRWLVARRLGADGLYLTTTSLTLTTGQDEVATTTIPMP
jgi:hypothetical protein